MFKKIKKSLKNRKGITTIEILSWIAVISLIVVAVATTLKPDIVGNNSILTNSSTRIKGLDTIMTP